MMTFPSPLPVYHVSVSAPLSNAVPTLLSFVLFPLTCQIQIGAADTIDRIIDIFPAAQQHQIDGIIYASSDANMISMDTSIYNLYKKGLISKATAISEAVNPEMMEKRLQMD